MICYGILACWIFLLTLWNLNQTIAQEDNRIRELTEFENVHKAFDELKSMQENMNEQLKLISTQLNQKPLETKKSQLQCDERLNCLQNYFGKVAPTSCQEAFTIAGSTKSGAYALELPDYGATPTPGTCVYCDYNSTGSWLFILRRKDGTQDFNRSWHDYKHGFGDVNGEYWLGLERVHQLTGRDRYELWVLLRDFDGNERNARYAEFNIANETEKYKLTVSNYSGDACDSLNYHNLKNFSTYDSDNDEAENFNCADDGGWWYSRCYETRLTGSYIGRLSTGFTWSGWLGFYQSLNYAHMAIRKVEKKRIVRNASSNFLIMSVKLAYFMPLASFLFNTYL